MLHRMNRIAVIGTPRSGNTWVRRLLATLYDLSERGADAFAAPTLDWDALPERCVLQVHTLPTPAFRSALARAGFRAVVLARHPFDVFCSLLHFVPRAHDVARCDRQAAGRRCEICPIVGAAPLDSRFLDGYALAADADELLAISRAWWSRPEVLRVRYEELVLDPAGRLHELAERLDPAPLERVAQAVAANTLAGLRAYFPQWDYHFWQGRPGTWRTFFPGDVARRLAEYHRPTLEGLGYTCEPDDGLTWEAAQANWERAAGPRP
jgi:hypothetical protein